MRVSLRNIKAIKQLSFEVPGPGLWILTGWNGSGKSTLLAALYRLGFSNAFQWYFKAGNPATTVDRYEDAEVEYEIRGEKVTYRYGGQRWRASPRKNAELIDKSGFADIFYLEANATRIEPHQHEIKSNRVYACDNDLLDFMEDVLGDSKWRDLKYVNTSRGRGSSHVRAYLIQSKVGSRNHYFSEKSFSLGELCVLRLAIKVLQAKKKSLILIDEVEMALHPEAQMRLLERIKAIAKGAGLTVIFSTHSATIIKQSDRKNLIYLYKSSDSIEVIRDAYPARILGDISSAGELSVDFLFYVEDEQAKILLESLIERYYLGMTSIRGRPRYRVVPVGGYPEVINMLASTNGLIPSYVKRASFLDNDARASVRDRLNNREEPFSTTHQAVRDHVHYLPWTPEVGLIEFLEGEGQAQAEARTLLADSFPTSTISPHSIVTQAAYLAITTDKPRLTAKKRRKHVVDTLCATTGAPPSDITRRLYGAYVYWIYRNHDGPLRALLGPELQRTS